MSSRATVRERRWITWRSLARVRERGARRILPAFKGARFQVRRTLCV